jgi:hypothetical protein
VLARGGIVRDNPFRRLLGRRGEGWCYAGTKEEREANQDDKSASGNGKQRAPGCEDLVEERSDARPRGGGNVGNANAFLHGTRKSVPVGRRALVGGPAGRPREEGECIAQSPAVLDTLRTGAEVLLDGLMQLRRK